MLEQHQRPIKRGARRRRRQRALTINQWPSGTMPSRAASPFDVIWPPVPLPPVPLPPVPPVAFVPPVAGEPPDALVPPLAGLPPVAGLPPAPVSAVDPPAPLSVEPPLLSLPQATNTALAPSETVNAIRVECLRTKESVPMASKMSQTTQTVNGVFARS